MQGTTQRRLQGMADPVLASMVRAMGLEEAPHYSTRPPKVMEYVNCWMENGKHRDGPVNPQRVKVTDQKGMTAQIKAKATELGADMMSICRLKPSMIDLGVDLPYEYVIATCVLMFARLMQRTIAIRSMHL